MAYRKVWAQIPLIEVMETRKIDQAENLELYKEMRQNFVEGEIMKDILPRLVFTDPSDPKQNNNWQRELRKAEYEFNTTGNWQAGIKVEAEYIFLNKDEISLIRDYIQFSLTQTKIQGNIRSYQKILDIADVLFNETK